MPKRSNQLPTLLLLLLVLISSCAGKKLLVNNADTLLEHQITKRFPLYSDQKKKLAKDVDRFLNDHKPLARELLPVVDALPAAKGDELEQYYHQLAGFYQTVAENFSSLLATHLTIMDSKQQKDFFKTLEQENRELKQKDSKDRMEKVYERFEVFFGTVSEQQKQHLTDLKAYFEDRKIQRLERREELHDELKRIFDRDVSSEARNRLFVEAFRKYQVKSADHQKNLEMIRTFLPTISEKQREHFRKRTEEVKEILNYFLEADY